jgi:hypothetical protein
VIGEIVGFFMLQAIYFLQHTNTMHWFKAHEQVTMYVFLSTNFRNGQKLMIVWSVFVRMWLMWLGFFAQELTVFVG